MPDMTKTADAQGKGPAIQSSRKCKECGNKYEKAREPDGSHCPPIEKRMGPRVTDPKHPSNDGSFTAYLESVGRLQRSVIDRPFNVRG